MKKKKFVGITAILLILTIAIVVLNFGKRSDDADSQDIVINETTIGVGNTEVGSEPEAAIIEINNSEVEMMSEGQTETVEDSETSKTEKVESSASSLDENVLSSTEQQMPETVRGEQVQEIPEAETPVETKPDSGNTGDSKEDKWEKETIKDDAENWIYGDTGERIFYRCDPEDYTFIISTLCEPLFYSGNGKRFYEQALALSDHYKQEHPFSAGSILKPYYPDINAVYWFTSSFDERYIVLEAYDTSHKRKFFRIRFTITDNNELDTVTVEELSDDDVAE